MLALGCESCLASCSDQISIVGRFRVDAGDVGHESETAEDEAGMASGDAAGSDEIPADAGGSAAPIGDTIAIESGTHAEFCAGSGPAVRLVSNASPGSRVPICTPGIGRRLFGYGLCSCGHLTVTAVSTLLTLDAFDSRRGGFAAAEGGAALGVNGNLRFGAIAPLFGVEGNAIVAGGGSLPGGNACLFGADLKTNAPIAWDNAGIFSVARDLWADADIRAPLVSSVGRDLYQTPGLYAPRALVQVRGTTPSTSTLPLDTYGSIFAASFEAQTLCALHYDRSVIELGESCDGPPPPRCDSCHQCPSGLACVDGACVRCRSDADCCEPLACAQGACQPLQLVSSP